MRYVDSLVVPAARVEESGDIRGPDSGVGETSVMFEARLALKESMTDSIQRRLLASQN